MKLSVTIITLNEEANIARAIESVSFANEILVIDSMSTDKTQEISKSLGAKVFEKKFMGYGQQKNYAASLCKGDWVLNIDADEQVSKELEKEINKIINSDSSKSLYKINRLTQFCGKWIHYGGWYPHFLARLCRANAAQWTTPQVHEDLIAITANDECGYIRSPLRHYSFPTISSQISTNLKYAQLGASQLWNRKQRRPYFFELLTRPFGKFVECYMIKFGFLDGTEGFVIAINAAHSMFMKYSMAYYDKKK